LTLVGLDSKINVDAMGIATITSDVGENITSQQKGHDIKTDQPEAG
jgi:hypothetical protein